ncbi:MAG: DUF116 domain-containing protein [Bacteroidota bacterium]
METVPYNLYPDQQFSNSFYEDLKIVTDIFIEKNSNRFSSIIDFYNAWLHKDGKTIDESPVQTKIEFLRIAIFWKNYAVFALENRRLTEKSALLLYKIRQNNLSLKPLADKIRGYLNTRLLSTQTNGRKILVKKKNIERLFNWLSATGEFTHELNRIKYIRKYIQQLNTNQLQNLMAGLSEIEKNFMHTCTQYLWRYTPNVENFINNTEKRYRNKENYIFTRRNRAEYYLNMVGAEILNRELQQEFNKTGKKVILLPKCMSKLPEHCKAEQSMNQITCKGCNPSCNINKLKQQFENDTTSVSLVPHSSSFSKYLKRWENSTEVGVIGVACVLNLLTGGYEMMSLNIPSQCVFLNYSGCKKHWSSKGISTNLNPVKLKEILSGQKQPAMQFDLSSLG